MVSRAHFHWCRKRGMGRGSLSVSRWFLRCIIGSSRNPINKRNLYLDLTIKFKCATYQNLCKFNRIQRKCGIQKSIKTLLHYVTVPPCIPELHIYLYHWTIEQVPLLARFRTTFALLLTKVKILVRQCYSLDVSYFTWLIHPCRYQFVNFYLHLINSEFAITI